MNIERPSWDESHMMHAILTATRTSCLKRPVGAALVKQNRIIATGYNGAAAGVESSRDHGYCHYDNIAYQESLRKGTSFELEQELAKSHCLAVHAEANALAQCSKMGIVAESSVLYVTNWPCPNCVKNHVIASGLVEVKIWKEYLANPLLTSDDRRASEAMLKQAGIHWSYVSLTNERIMQIAVLMCRVGDRTAYKFDPSQVLPSSSNG